MLPYIEEQSVFDLCVETTERDGGFTAAGPAYAQYKVISTYLCPSEPNPIGPQGYGRGLYDGIGGPTGWGVSNYAGNYLVFGDPDEATTEGTRKFRAIKDGLSNTIFFAERYANCTNTGSTSSVYTSLWSDSTNFWRPIFCVNELSRYPTEEGYPACGKFQVAPDWLTECDPSRAQSPHTAGMNVCLGDGSVRFVSGGIADSTWALLCDPRDEEVAPANW